ncbi:MAG: SsrA-binding protein, partial [Verrucomicrobiales bacterium]|nr:SsrA-binding protein [Verrucomicrobiales bacterium]
MSDIATNKKARRDFLISDTYECGIVLRGTEVKSIRAGKANMSESFARVDRNELWLYNCDIRPYDHTAGFFQHETTAPRKLLMHRLEIDRIFGMV